MTNSKERLANLTVEDILEDPRSFGMPSFEEFRKDPEKYKGRHDENLALAGASTTIRDLRDLISTQTYECMGYDCGKSLEKVEYVAKNEGYQIDQLDMIPRITPESGGKVSIRVHFQPKAGAIQVVNA